MPSRLSIKSAKILVIESLSARRMMFMESFRKAGWTGVISAGTLKDAVSILETDPVPPDWIIAPLNDASNVNGLHLLSLTVTHEKLQRTRVSLILDEGNESILPSAYAMGLLSHHGKVPETGLQMDSFFEVYTVGQALEWNETLIASTYLRRELVAQQKFEDLVALERRLLSLFADRVECVVRLAEAFLLAGKNQDALVVLSRVKGLSPALEAMVTDLMAKATVRHQDAASCVLPSVAERLDLKTAVIVDSDGAAAKQTEDTLKELGILSIKSFADGASAWSYLSENPEPNLIIQEWRLPKLSGDVLIQRVRQHGFRACSVIVFSSLVKASDRMLLREMGVTDVIEKPQAPKRFGPVLTALLQQDRKPSEEKVLERKVRQAVEAQNFTLARHLFEALCAKPNTTDGLKKSIESEFAFKEGRLDAAHQLAIESIHMLGEDAYALNLLGKIYHKRGQAEKAAKLFGRASELSPQNIQRLCALAESQIEAGDQESAETSLDSAKKIDAQSPKVLETDAKVSLAGGNSDRVRELMEKAADNSRLVAFMNNRAVSLVAEKKVKEASELYKTAIKSLPAKLKHLTPIIQYNLALSSVRLGDLDAAISQLAEASLSKDATSNQKVRSLLARANTAKGRGEPLKLNLSVDALGAPDAVAPEEKVELIEGLPVRAGCRGGDFCCHMVFQPALGIDSKFLQMLANGPKFRDRKITLGFDKSAS